MGNGTNIKKVLIGFFLAVLLVSVFTWIGNEVLLSRRGVKSDFFPLWYGTQSVLKHSNPYSDAATEEIHQFLYPGTTLHRGYKVHLAYPAFIAVVLLPFGLLPYQPALLIWIGLQLPLLFLALQLMRRFLDLELRGLQGALLFISGSIGFLYPLLSYSLGQMSIVLMLLFVSTFYFIQTRKPVWAGITLALMIIRPDMFLIGMVSSLVLTWDTKQEMKLFGISTIASLIVINLITILFIGFWYFDWIHIVTYYSASNPHTHWPLEHLPNTASRVALIILSVVYFIWQAIQFIRHPARNEKLLVISALFVIYQLIATQTGSYHMTLLLIPTLILLYLYAQYHLQWIMWAMLFSPWLFWGVIGVNKPWLDQLLVPLSLLIVQVIYVGMSRYKQALPPTRAVNA